jgi:hypothetical protein
LPIWEKNELILPERLDRDCGILAIVRDIPLIRLVKVDDRLESPLEKAEVM